MNQQKKLKQDLSRDGVGKALQVSKIFSTIQGEGPFSGMPAIFIRLAGCNLQCYWCDTDYSAQYQNYVDDIIEKVDHHSFAHGLKFIVITGGEPFRQNITPLVTRLLASGFRIQIETSGSLSNPGFPFDKVVTVCSPKTGKLHSDMQHAGSWKYILQAGAVDSSDGLPSASTQLKGLASSNPVCRPMNNRPVFVSPVDDETYDENMQAIVDSAMKYGYRISLQTHKILGVE